MKASDPRTLPRWGLALTTLGLGCSQWGGLYRDVSLGACVETLATAWEAGIRYVDTAPYYGYTRSERRVGTLLDDAARAGAVLSTKVGRLLVPDQEMGMAAGGAMVGEWSRPLPFRPVYDYSHDGILRSFDASQQRLGRVRIDILYVHDIGRLTHGERHHHHWTALTTGGGFRALGELRAQGRIGAVGLGVNECEAVADAIEAFDIDIAMLAGRYTLLEQTGLDQLDHCRRHQVGIVAAGVFNSGILAGNDRFNYGDAPPAMVERVRRLQAACDAFDVPLPAAALQFPLHHPAVVSCVVGARSAAQIGGNVAALETPVPSAFWDALKRDGLLDAGAPTDTGS